MKTRFFFSASRRHVVSLLVVAMVLLGGISPVVVAGCLRAEPRVAAASTVRLQAVFSSSDGGYTGRFVPLDPMTLADRAGAIPLELNAPTWQTAVSADGSTLVTIKSGSSTRIVVLDALTGEQRRRFKSPVSVFEPVLSRDGSRLIASDFTCCDSTRNPVWYVFDTANGRLIAEVAAREPDLWGSLPIYIPPELIDPVGRHLYRLIVPATDHDSGPRSVTLVAYDLTTGDEQGRLVLPDVLGGAWPAEHRDRIDPVKDHLTPGFALAPDGQTIAVVHADNGAVTLIDVDHFVVVRTVLPKAKTGLARRLLGLLPLAPRTAAAKELYKGPTVRAVFAPDGRGIYVFGEQDNRGGAGLGLKRIDLNTGTIEADGLRGENLLGVLPAPDGETLYVLSVSTGWILRRVDAEALSVEANRVLGTYTLISVTPA